MEKRIAVRYGAIPPVLWVLCRVGHDMLNPAAPGRLYEVSHFQPGRPWEVPVRVRINANNLINICLVARDCSQS